MLYCSLWHQGTIYQATSHAAPFFIEIAADETREDLAEVLGYLAALADGMSYIAAHRDLSSWRGGYSFQELELELSWVAQTRAAVSAGLPLYLRLLRHSSAKTRTAACYVLSRHPERSAEILPCLEEMFDHGDEDELARAACVLAISQVAKEPGPCPPQLHRAFVAAEPPAVRAVAAVAIPSFDQEQTGEPVRAYLGELAADSYGFMEMLERLAWGPANPLLYLTPALREAGPGEGASIDRLAAALATDKAAKNGYMAEFILAAAFQDNAAPEPPSPEALKALQQRAIAAIAGSDGFWEWALGSPYAEMMLSRHQLPVEREAFRDYAKRSGLR